MKTKSKLKKTVGVIIIGPSGKFLLQLRDIKKGIVFPGVWALFGGEIKKGEIPEQTIYREFEEETGILLQNLTFFKTICLPDRTSDIYISRVDFEDTSKIKLAEGRGAQFFTIEEIHTLLGKKETNRIVTDLLDDYYKEFLSKKINMF